MAAWRRRGVAAAAAAAAATRRLRRQRKQWRRPSEMANGVVACVAAREQLAWRSSSAMNDPPSG